jgi:hypothetical protein
MLRESLPESFTSPDCSCGNSKGESDIRLRARIIFFITEYQACKSNKIVKRLK